MTRKQIFIACLIAILPILLYSTAILRWSVSEKIILHVIDVKSTTYFAHKSGIRTSFTINANYQCLMNKAQCICNKYSLTEDNYVSGDGKSFMQDLYQLVNKKTVGYVAIFFGKEYCWFKTDFYSLKSMSLIFGIIAFVYMYRCSTGGKYVGNK